MTETPEPVSDTTDTEAAEQPVPDDADTFPRDYVEKLRKESAGYRTERDQLSELLAVVTRERIDIEILSYNVKPDRTGLRSGSTTGPQLPRTEKFVDAFKPARER